MLAVEGGGAHVRRASAAPESESSSRVILTLLSFWLDASDDDTYIEQLCSSLSIPPKVRGTALTYFHRFYLHHSVMDAEPKSIMMAAVYVACKTEESPERLAQ